jgi:hypothetical protein
LEPSSLVAISIGCEPHDWSRATVSFGQDRVNAITPPQPIPTLKPSSSPPWQDDNANAGGGLGIVSGMQGPRSASSVYKTGK